MREQNYPLPGGLVQDSNISTDRATGLRFVESQHLIRVLKVQEEFVAGLDKAAKEPAIDLDVRSKPSQATFTLSTYLGEARSTTTNNMLPNVDRGLYRYKITLPGFKTVDGELNLVSNRRGRVVCILIRESEPRDSLPCSQP